MNSKVIVLADDTTGAVVNVSENNPKYGYVRVSQVRTVVDEMDSYVERILQH